MIAARGLSKRYLQADDRAHGISRIDLTFSDGEIVLISGSIGAGKTTLLRLLAGLEVPDEGDLDFGEGSRTGMRIGFLHQDFRSALLPWRTVKGNLEFALEGDWKGDIEGDSRSVADALRRFALDPLALRRAGSLSGGQAQTTAIARTFVGNPELLLLDEPFSSLDSHGSLRVLDELVVQARKTGSTIVFASHDLGYALRVAHRVVVLRQGEPGAVILGNEELGDEQLPLEAEDSRVVELHRAIRRLSE